MCLNKDYNYFLLQFLIMDLSAPQGEKERGKKPMTGQAQDNVMVVMAIMRLGDVAKLVNGP